MLAHKYGEFTQNQMSETKQSIRRSIFFLLLIVDPKTKDEYKDVNVVAAFSNLLHKLGGMNSVLREPPELVSVISLLEAALIEFTSPDYNWQTYRKLILDAGNEVLKVKEVD